MMASPTTITATRLVIAGPEDARALADIHVASWRRAYRDIVPASYLAGLSIDERERAWRELLARGETKAALALVDGEAAGLVAFGAARDADHDTAVLSSLYVRPEYWGRGCGGALWEHARSHLHRRGFRRVELWVLAGNQRAIGFYRARGCEPIPGQERTLILGGTELLAQRLRAGLDDASAD